MEKHNFSPSSSSSSLFAPDSSFVAITDAVPLRMIKPKNPKFEVLEEYDDDDDVSSELTLESKSKKPRVNSKGEFSSQRFNSVTSGDNEVEGEVSTNLALFDEAWIASNWKSVQDSARRYSASVSRTKKPLSRDAVEAELNQKVAACTISAMKYYNAKEEQEERQIGVSTKLKLYEGEEGPFKIKKKITKSDLGNSCRLLLGSSLVQTHVLSYFSEDRIKEVESKKGASVAVWDKDTETEHRLILKRWGKWKSYVLIEKWKSEFVQRRGLKERDEIGLYWDPYNSRFNFSLRKRAPGN